MGFRQVLYRYFLALGDSERGNKKKSYAQKNYWAVVMASVAAFVVSAGDRSSTIAGSRDGKLSRALAGTIRLAHSFWE